MNVLPPHQPSKRFGQHFLADPRVVDRIIQAFAPKQNETVVEIGPGTGALTRVLLHRVARLIAIEFDRNLVLPLKKEFGDRDNFKLIEGDALTINFCEAMKPAQNARLIANLPYNISTAIVQQLISQRRCVSEMVVMLQREVVERMIAPPGSSDRGYFSVLLEVYSKIDKLFDVAPGSFTPPPKVWSTVIRLSFRPAALVEARHEALLWSVVSAGFAQKRKTIVNNFRNASGALQGVLKRNGGASIVLCKAGVEVSRRAETLTVNEWINITHALLA
ncbi:MAG: 16S rRNA (adenine(1518)-N(6)/adenine(1519)-N(6))-dimethyltransferase RsmA [Pyrinomonadaceae bacterium]